MQKYKRRWVWLIGAVGSLAVMLLSVILLLPAILNQQAIRDKLLAEISRQAGIKLESQSLAFRILPFPRLSLYRVHLTVPGQLSAHLETLAVVPRIWPLFAGRLELGEVRVENFNFVLTLPKETVGNGVAGRGEPFSAPAAKDVGSALALLHAKWPGLKVHLIGGEIDLYQKTAEPLLRFRELALHAELSPAQVKLDLSCQSDLMEAFSLKGWLDPDRFTGEVQTGLTGFHPHKLARAFTNLNAPDDHAGSASANSASGATPGAPLVKEEWGDLLRKLTDSSVDVQVLLTIHSRQQVQGTFQGAIPRLEFETGSQPSQRRVPIICDHLAGAFDVGQKGLELTLSAMDLSHPEAHLGGKLLLQEHPTRAVLELEGRELDVASLRETALALAGEHSTVSEIFTVMQAGRIPWIRFHAQGESMAQWGNPANMVIHGNMEGGSIFIPGVSLGIEAASGNVVIAQGILHGKDLAGSTGVSSGRNGHLILGLAGDDRPFHLEIDTEADLGELLPILKRTVPHKSFQEELAQITGVTGRASGRLVLGESLHDIRPSVQVEDMHLSCRYARLPYPVSITQGRIALEARAIAMADLAGKLGGSSFSGLSAELNWEQEPALKVQSLTARVVMDELYPWLISYPRVRNAMGSLRSMTGVVVVDGLDFTGPLLRPEQWRFALKGGLEHFTLWADFLPGPLLAAKGGLEVTPEKLALVKAESTLLDASGRVSGALWGYLKGPEKADCTVDGNIGPEAAEWIYGRTAIPAEYRIRPPVQVSGAHVNWQSAGKWGFSGKLAVLRGPQISVQLAAAPDGLDISNLSLTGEDSRASLSLTLKPGEMKFSYAGHLSSKALDQLLVDNRILKGMIDGDFTCHTVSRQPVRFGAEGKLRITGLSHLWGSKVPLFVTDASLAASQGKVTVESMALNLGAAQLALTGTVDLSGQHPDLALQVSAGDLDWHEIEQTLGEIIRPAAVQHQATAADGDFQPRHWRGTLVVQAESFKYRDFTWRPFQARIHFLEGGVDIDVTRAIVCGIDAPGVVKVSDQGVELDLRFSAKAQDLNPTVVCLLDRTRLMTGEFDLDGKLVARGKDNPLADYSRGSLEFLARNGRIYRANTLAKILAVLNLTEIFRGRVPDLTREGFAYSTMKITGTLQDGQLTLGEAFINGSSMKLFGNGDIDLLKNEMNLNVFVAPLKTVDKLVSRVPLLGKVLTGKSKTLLSYPFRVTGPIDDAQVTALPQPVAIVSGVMGIIERTLRLPLDIIRSLLPCRQ